MKTLMAASVWYLTVDAMSRGHFSAAVVAGSYLRPAGALRAEVQSLYCPMVDAVETPGGLGAAGYDRHCAGDAALDGGPASQNPK